MSSFIFHNLILSILHLSIRHCLFMKVATYQTIAMQLNVNSTNLTGQFSWRSLVSQNLLPLSACFHLTFETGMVTTGDSCPQQSNQLITLAFCRVPRGVSYSVVSKSSSLNKRTIPKIAPVTPPTITKLSLLPEIVEVQLYLGVPASKIQLQLGVPASWVFPSLLPERVIVLILVSRQALGRIWTRKYLSDSVICNYDFSCNWYFPCSYPGDFNVLLKCLLRNGTILFIHFFNFEPLTKNGDRLSGGLGYCRLQTGCDKKTYYADVLNYILRDKRHVDTITGACCHISRRQPRCAQCMECPGDLGSTPWSWPSHRQVPPSSCPCPCTPAGRKLCSYRQPAGAAWREHMLPPDSAEILLLLV